MIYIIYLFVLISVKKEISKNYFQFRICIASRNIFININYTGYIHVLLIFRNRSKALHILCYASKYCSWRIIPTCEKKRDATLFLSLIKIFMRLVVVIERDL